MTDTLTAERAGVNLRELGRETVVTAAWIARTWRGRTEPDVRHEHAHALYIMRCEWADRFRWATPHARCWLCGTPSRRLVAPSPILRLRGVTWNL